MNFIDRSFYDFILSYTTNMYHSLLVLVDEQLEKDLRELEQEIATGDSQIEHDYYDHLPFQLQQLEERRAVFLNAFFASSYALFEHELVKVCDQAQGRAESLFSVKDIKGSNDMERVKTYLKKLGVDFPADSVNWQQATRYRMLRNKVVHAAGSLSEDAEATKYAKDNGILDENFGILHLTRTFCEEALENMKQVVLQIYDAYEQWYHNQG